MGVEMDIQFVGQDGTVEGPEVAQAREKNSEKKRVIKKNSQS